MQQSPSHPWTKMAKTYTVTSWEKKKKSSKTYTDESGNTWAKKGTRMTYEYGNTIPIKTETVYKTKVSSAPKPEPPKPTIIPPGPPDPLLIPGSDQGEDVAQYTSPTYTTPSGDVAFTSFGPVEENLYLEFGRYLNAVDAHNENLKKQIDDFYRAQSLYYDMPGSEAAYNAQLEYNNQKLPRLSFEDWKLQNAAGKIDLTQGYSAPPELLNEMQKLDEVNDVFNKFLTGMGIGWDIANKLYLPQLAVLKALNEIDFLKQPDNYALKNVLTNITYGAGGQLARNLEGVSTVLLDDYDRANYYKSSYEKLNEEAKQRGIIKNDWKLKLNQSIPLTERYRRLYATLLAYMKKKLLKSTK